jgi:hypothetical protein
VEIWRKSEGFYGYILVRQAREYQREGGQFRDWGYGGWIYGLDAVWLI